MADQNIKIISLNCSGVHNKIPLLREMCETYNLILLQETWITPENINMLDNIHPDFCCHSIFAVAIDRRLVGRPHGGLTILWNNKMGVKCSINMFDDHRMLGITIENNSRKLLLKK